jgi:cytochrome c
MMKVTVFTLLALAAAGAFAQPESPGEKLARSQCLQCHTLGRGEPHGVGPNLYGLLGRPAGAATGFAYSEKFSAAMKGRTWNATLVDQWLKDTQALAPGNGMTYVQDDARKRKLIIGYIQTLK